MALITVSGYPCSGKSRRVEQLKTYLESRLAESNAPTLNVAVVSDDSLDLKRDVYNDGRSEKPARAALFTAMQRLMGKDTILIVDSLNYIKGFRYQMYCAAREHRLRMCTLYVVSTTDLCREWNASRHDTENKYEAEILENLIMRFEEPSSMVRWDSPLFTVPWSDEGVPAEQIWLAITEGVVRPPNSGTSAVAVTPSDALHTLERTVTSMVTAIIAEQAPTGGMGGPIILPLSPTLKVKLVLPARNVTLSELQRLRRQFVTIHKKAITLGTAEKGSVDWGEENVSQKFVTYLEENLKPV